MGKKIDTGIAIEIAFLIFICSFVLAYAFIIVPIKDNMIDLTEAINNNCEGQLPVYLKEDINKIVDVYDKYTIGNSTISNKFRNLSK